MLSFGLLEVVIQFVLSIVMTIIAFKSESSASADIGFIKIAVLISTILLGFEMFAVLAITLGTWLGWSKTTLTDPTVPAEYNNLSEKSKGKQFRGHAAGRRI